jgi:hypothetical protein
MLTTTPRSPGARPESFSALDGPSASGAAIGTTEMLRATTGARTRSSPSSSMRIRSPVTSSTRRLISGSMPSATSWA